MDGLGQKEMKIRAGSGGGRNGDLTDGGSFPKELQPLHRCESYDSVDPKPAEFGHIPFGEKTVTEERVNGKSNARKSACAIRFLLIYTISELSALGVYGNKLF